MGCRVVPKPLAGALGPLELRNPQLVSRLVADATSDVPFAQPTVSAHRVGLLAVQTTPPQLAGLINKKLATAQTLVPTGWAMKRVKPSRVKIHRNYTLAETAQLLGVHKTTVHRWIKRGLRICNDRRPILILGGDLRAFLLQQRAATKKPCGPGQLYCVRCRAPKAPASGMIDYIPTTTGSGYLQGICPDCDTLIHRAASVPKLHSIAGGLAVAFPRAKRGVSEPAPALVSAHFGSALDVHD